MINQVLKGFLIALSTIAVAACASDLQTQQTSALIGNLVTVDRWVNRYQLSRPYDPPNAATTRTTEAGENISVYPRLIDLKEMLLKNGTIKSLDKSPLVNPVSKLREWPKESLRSFKDYTALQDDCTSFVGKGVIEFIPFVDGNMISGYMIRAGDPVTGKVLCTDGTPCLRSNP